MGKYIGKSALVAEIKDLYEDIDKCIGDLVLARSKHDQCGISDAHWKMETLMVNTQQVLSYILRHLEVKKVDLEKELSYEDYKSFFEKYPDLSDDWGFDETWTCAKYFFELGLKVKQESNDEVKIGETQIYLEDDGGEPPYEGKQWLDFSCMEYEIPKTLFKDGDNVEILIRKAQKGKNI